MPITIPRPSIQAAPVIERPPAEPTPDYCTMAEVEVMLAGRDAAWQARLDALALTLTTALNGRPQKRPRYVATHEYNERDMLVKTTLIPKD